MNDPAVRCECPICGKTGAKRIGAAVEPLVQGGKLKDRVIGAVYGCLRCGVAYTVIAATGETFSVRAPSPNFQRDGDRTPPPRNRNYDPDIAHSPEDLP